MDITAELTNKIQGKIPLSTEIEISVPTITGTGGSLRNHVPRIKIIKVKKSLNLSALTFDNLTIEDSFLKLENEPHKIGLPNSDSFTVIPYDNPLISQQTISIEHSYKLTKGWKIDFTQIFVSSTKVGGSLKFDVGGVGGNASFEKTVTDTITNSESVSETTEISGKLTVPFNIPAKIKVRITIGIQNFEARRNFEGNIIVNGNITIGYGNSEKVEVKKISDILGESERTFNVSGYYANIDWEELPINIEILENY